MTPEIAALILQCLIKYGPDVARAITVIFHKKEPTLEDWNAAFDLAKNPIVQVSDVPKFADDAEKVQKLAGLVAGLGFPNAMNPAISDQGA